MKYVNGKNDDTALSSCDNRFSGLKADCEKCFGFCCVALYFSASEGFPKNKDAGKPCFHLQANFKCCVHKDLRKLGFKGCTSYDCFGAGQKTAQITYGGRDWKQAPESSGQMFDVFLIIYQLHEMLWYLADVLAADLEENIQNELSTMFSETERLTLLSADSLLKLDLAAHRAAVKSLISKVSESVREKMRIKKMDSIGSRKTFVRGLDLIGVDLRGKNLRGENMRGACLIAADLRGADLRGTDPWVRIFGMPTSEEQTFQEASFSLKPRLIRHGAIPLQSCPHHSPGRFIGESCLMYLFQIDNHQHNIKRIIKR